jgi:toluene monooxygenase system protein E
MKIGRPPPRKTYSRLASGRRVPPEYEIVSSDLHYNYPHRFELPETLPVVDWYYRNREGSPMRANNWEAFSDPRRTTYRGYNELRDRREDMVDGLFREIDETGYDDELDGAWVTFLDLWYAPLRYPAHGMQMLSAYVAQLAPASRISNCAAFQAADEMRRLQRIAHRTAQLAEHRTGVNTGEHRQLWEEADAFQPLRELIERALVTYDWGQAFIVTNVVIKPRLDRLVNEAIAGNLAVINHDPILRDIHFSFNEDARWHRDWTATLLQVAISDTPANADLVAQWVETWKPLADDALSELAGIVAKAPVPLNPSLVASQIAAGVAQDLVPLLMGEELERG